MSHHRCTDCRRPVPVGAAVIRSQMFKLVAFHRECWAVRRLPVQHQQLAGSAR